MKVAYEAGPFGFGLHDQLREDGIEVIVVPPSLIPMESDNRVKTDKRDSRKVSQTSGEQYAQEDFVLAREDRADRELLRTRRQILNHRNDGPGRLRVSCCFMGSDLLFQPEQDGPGFYPVDERLGLGERGSKDFLFRV